MTQKLMDLTGLTEEELFKLSDSILSEISSRRRSKRQKEATIVKDALVELERIVEENLPNMPIQCSKFDEFTYNAWIVFSIVDELIPVSTFGSDGGAEDAKIEVWYSDKEERCIFLHTLSLTEFVTAEAVVRDFIIRLMAMRNRLDNYLKRY
jgi:hypothetical protein